MSKWTTIDNSHYNLDRITSFNWQNGCLYLRDTEEQPFSIVDKTGEWYRALCAVVGVTPLAKQAVQAGEGEHHD